MAGTNSLGRLTLDLVLKAGAFTQGLTAAERQANKSLSAIEKRAYKFGQVVGAGIRTGAVLATAALGALAVAVGSAIDKADSMRDLSIRTGIATERLSEYAYAAKQTGTDIDGLGRGLKILAKNLAEAADPKSGKGKLFEALGVGVKDAEGNLKQLDAILPQIADKFKQLEDGTTKAALAQELFGKSGLELIEFLNQGSAGLQTAADKARALGIVISSQTANAADEFNDKLGDLRAGVEGFSLQLAAKLLPQLIELVDKVNEFAGDGETAARVANGLAKTVDLLAGVMGVASKSTDLVNAAMGTMIGLLSSATAVAQGFLSLDFSKVGQGLSGGIAALRAGADMAINGGGGAKQRKTLLDPNRANFSDVTSSVAGRKTVEEMLADLFAGGGKGAKTGGGKSQAAKKTDELTESFKRMVAQLKEQAAMVGVVTEVEKLRYDLNNGELSKLTEAQKTELLNLAQIADFRREDYENLQESIKAEEEKAEVARRAKEQYEEVNKSILEQIKLLGMSSDEQEVWNNLAWAGVEADSERGKVIAENTRRLQEQRDAMDDQIEVMDSLRDAGSNFLADWIGGSKSFKDSLLDAWESVHQKILSMIAENLMDQLFGKQGDPGGGSAGGWIGSLLGAFFGGGPQITGFATGGNTSPWSVSEVNERGFEMASVGGKDYLLTGDKSVRITPNHKLGGGLNQVNNYNVQGRIDRRTRDDIAADVGRRASNAGRRNGR